MHSSFLTGFDAAVVSAARAATGTAEPLDDPVVAGTYLERTDFALPDRTSPYLVTESVPLVVQVQKTFQLRPLMC